MSKVVLAFIALLAAALAGCSADRPMSPDHFSELKENIEVAPGETVAVRLPTSFSEGYRWQLAQPLNERLVKLVKSSYRRSEPAEPGMDGYQVLVFQAVAEGNATIPLQYVRFRDKSAEPEKVANFGLVIRNSNTSPISLPFGL